MKPYNFTFTLKRFNDDLVYGGLGHNQGGNDVLSNKIKRGFLAAFAGASVFSLSLTGIAPANAATTITVLIDNTESTSVAYKAMNIAFEKANPTIKVKMSTRPGGADGDNLIKTKLATGQMADVFQYNTGSLFQALNPAKTLLDLSKEPWQKTVQSSFKQTVSVGSKVYGAPYGPAMGGGILYNKKVYASLGLKVPTTWAEFMANNAEIKDAGIAPVIQTYGDTWTSQLFVLGDFYNVQAADPKFAVNYTNNKAKYATSAPAIKGFQYLEKLNKLGYFNSDYASAKYNDGIEKIAKGTGAHYPMLTFAINDLKVSYPDKLADIGFFAQPGASQAKNGLTVWTGTGVYISAKTKAAAAAKKYVAFVASKQGTDIQTKTIGQSGPYFTSTASAPSASLPGAVKDIFKYFDVKKTGPALEFLSPIKGPNLEQICVSIGTGQTTALKGAALYDEDVKKQAKQLGIKGW
jgi:raffinose/stachyose/melibiose transport system substrate-binding protein